MSPDPWSPERYLRFAEERAAPFHDLLALVGEVAPGGRAVDLGCGTGALTATLHRTLGMGTTLGVDSSQAMLGKAEAHAGAGLSFARGDLEADDLGTGGGPFDVVFSNAALHWVDGHPALLPRLAALLAPGGVLAVQVPANERHLSQRAAVALAQTEPFAQALDGWVRRTPVMEPEGYAMALADLGLDELSVRAQVYLHQLPDAEALVTWMAGTTLTAYERRLPAGLFEQFLKRYGRVLAEQLPGEGPVPFPFRRILFRARRPHSAADA
jgi:trans-aconitate 2-methyltransferase